MKDQLTYLLETYYEKEEWHKSKLELEDAMEHFNRMLDAETILTHEEDGEIVGYLEVWFLDREQAERVVDGGNLDVLNENITNGQYALVVSAYVEPEYRNRGILKMLNKRMQKTHADQDYVGVMYDDSRDNGKLRLFKKGEI